MPTGNLTQIEAREAAHKKLVEAEKFVDTFQSIHADAMQKDGEDGYDQSPVEGVVRYESMADKSQSNLLVSNIEGANHLKQLNKKMVKGKDYQGNDKDVGELEFLSMETNQKRDRVTFVKKEYKNQHIYRNQTLSDLEAHERPTTEVIMHVVGTGEERVFQFGEIGFLQSAWESLSSVAGSIGRTLSPLKGAIPVSIKFGKSKG